jgi:hypothetical protein
MSTEARTSDHRNGVRTIRSRKRFIEWLRKQPSGARYGARADKCILARYCGGRVGWCTYDRGALPEWAIEFLADTDEIAAELKAQVRRKEFLCKRVRSHQITLSEGSIELRKAKAEISNAVIDSETELADAIVEFETILNKRTTKVLILEVWRSINANRRVGNV